MKVVKNSTDTPTEDEVRAALERIVSSRGFLRSPQLVAFLRFVVNSALDGHPEDIKSYTIGVEAFGRCERFDPQADPIVRVEAARLRKALAGYFDGQGARDPIMITMPLGTYVPTFCHRKKHHSLIILGAALMRTLRTMLAPSWRGSVLLARARQTRGRAIRTPSGNH
jgi:hypothetical protein